MRNMHTDEAKPKTSNIENGAQGLHCKKCDAFLGSEDQSADGWRLQKSSIAVKLGDVSPWETFSPTTFVCAQLLALIDSQAIRKFVLHSGDSGTEDTLLVG